MHFCEVHDVSPVALFYLPVKNTYHLLQHLHRQRYDSMSPNEIQNVSLAERLQQVRHN